MTLRRPLVMIGGLMQGLPAGDRVPSSEIGARVFRSTAQSIPNGSYTAVSFSNTRYNQGSLWTAGAPAVLTIPTAGKYLVGASVRWFSAATGLRGLAIRIVGGSTIAQAEYQQSPAQVVNTVWNFAASNQVECLVFQSSGAALDLTANTSHSPEFWIQRIGE